MNFGRWHWSVETFLFTGVSFVIAMKIFFNWDFFLAGLTGLVIAGLLAFEKRAEGLILPAGLTKQQAEAQKRKLRGG